MSPHLADHLGAPEQALAARVDRVRAAAGDRMADLELNLFIAGVGERPADVDLSVIMAASGKSAEDLADLPGVLIGSPRQLADKLLHYRAEFGISYISVIEPHLEQFATVIPLLR